MSEYQSCEACGAELATVELFFGTSRSDGTVWLGNKCARLLQIFARFAGKEPRLGTPMRVVT